ncbi:MAG: vWA domain-containing protein [Isosphaeraceae bacterium]
MSQQIKVKGVADIVFLLDATGSMAPCISAVKENIAAFITSLTTKDANDQSVVKDWRVKIVGYRDFEYTDYPAIVDNPFVTSVEEARSHLAKLEAAGGGDEPESLLEGLYRVATMPETGLNEPLNPDCWRHRSEGRRFVIVFTDATYKARMSEPRGGTVDDVINAMMNSRIILYVYAPEPFECYETLREMDKSEWYPVPVPEGSTPQKALEEFTSSRENFQKILDVLAKTITQTAAIPPL